MTERSSVKVLQECIELQTAKSRDYQNAKSTVRQADYYPHGVNTIMDIIHAKTLRIRSVIEAMENDPDYKPNFESMEDSLKDMINYASFAVAYSRGEVDGQSADHDFLNRQLNAPVSVSVSDSEPSTLLKPFTDEDIDAMNMFPTHSHEILKNNYEEQMI